MSSSARIDELRRKFDENPRRYFAPLANEYRKVGDFDQAIFICQEYLPQQPGHMSGHIVFGQALFEAKRLPEARTVFETALTLDPENLIALRHLADISRDLGEFAAARTWYERVLQADPRNEEIAAIMSTMAPPPPAPVEPTLETPATAAPAPSVEIAAAAPTVELSAAAVREMMNARLASQAQSTTAAQEAASIPLEMVSLDDAETIEVRTIPEPPPPPVAAPAPPTLEGFESTISTEEKFDIPSGGMLGLEPTSAAGVEEPPVVARAEGLETMTLDDFSLPTATPPTPPASPEVAPAADVSTGLMDLGSFSFGDSSPTTEPVASAHQAAEASPALEMISLDEPVAGEVAAPMDFDFEVPTGSADAPSSAPPSLDSMPTVVMTAIPDLPPPAALDIIEDVVAPIVDAAPSAPVAANDIVSPTVIMGAIRIDPPAPEPIPATVQMDVVSIREAVEARQKTTETPAPAAEAAMAAPSAAAAAFVTETMAQLYLEQGHRAEALDIYRQLVAAKPDDTALRARFEAIEQSSRAATPMPAVAPPPVVQAPLSQRFAATGPTIRSVLRDLFGVDAESTHSNGSTQGEPGAEVGSIDILFSANAVADAPTPLAVAFDGGYVASNGNIDAIFAGGV